MNTIVHNQLSHEIIEQLDNLNQNFLRIDLHGKRFVILKEEEYLEIISSSENRSENLTEFFRKSPLFGVDLDLERDKTPSRETEF